MSHMILGTMMAPSNTTGTYTDKYGYTWDYVGLGMGLRRREDRFFIPSITVYDHENHSVEAREIIKKRIRDQKESGRTTVVVSSFDGWVVHSTAE